MATPAQTLRRNFWLVPLPLVAIAALLNARAVTSLVGVGMELDKQQLAQSSAGSQRIAPGPTSSARVATADPILKRNPFDHVTGPLVVAPSPVSTADGGVASRELDTSDPWNAPTCDGVDVKVILASDDEDWSLAAVGVPSEKKSRLLRRGGEVAGKKVHFVGGDRVWLSSETGLCQAVLFDKTTPPPTAASAPPASSSSSSAPSRSTKALDPDLKKGIQAVSATEFNIDRGVVDKILENQADLMRQARIVPVQENGRVIGVRLGGVRPDTLLGVLGMQNNDVLKTINGFEMASPERALEAYARLRTAEKLTIQVNRGGKDLNLDYNIK